MSATTNFIDLDEVDPAVPTIVIKLNGVEHQLVPLTVEGFIANTRDQNELNKVSETDPDAIEKNISLVIKMLTRTFPTVAEDDLRKLPLAKLWKLLEFARNAGGQAEVEQEAAKAEENPPTAG